jgi:hypothetical protein
VKQFLSIIKECADEKLSQEEALKKLDKAYKSANTKNKQKITDILKNSKFYDYDSHTVEQQITIYDKSINTKSKSERENNIKIIEDNMMYYISKIKDEKDKKRLKKILAYQPLDFDEFEIRMDNEIEQATIEIRIERDKIAELCQEGRKIKKYYEKSVDKIIDVHITTAETQKPAEIEKEKMSPKIKEMLADRIITGEKINGKWIVTNEKHGIKELIEWAVANNGIYSTTYIIQTFCKRNGKSFTRGSINTFKSKNGLTGK